MRLDEDMGRVVGEQSLGFAATVCPDGTPNLSPKGTTIVWGDDQLVFLDLHSPGTVANLATNPAIEINVVDPIVRKGYRFKGHARVLTEGRHHDAVVDYFERHRGTDRTRVRGVVLVDVETAAPLVSPVYDTGLSEADVIQRWRAQHLGLADIRLGVRRPPEPGPDLVCDLAALTPEERAHHEELASRLVARHTEVDETPHGYAFVFPADPAVPVELAEWVALEQRCCPFLDFHLDLTSNGVRMDIAGPPGVKELVRGEFGAVIGRESTNQPVTGGPPLSSSRYEH